MYFHAQLQKKILNGILNEDDDVTRVKMKVLLAKQWHARWHDQKTARRWENNIKKVMTLGCQSCGYSSYTHYTHTRCWDENSGKDPNLAHFFLCEMVSNKTQHDNENSKKIRNLREYWENKTSSSQLYAMKVKGKKGVSTKKGYKDKYHLSIV